jgi:phosphatidylinositol alpha-1,6-mannosyltransferase
MKIGYLIHGLDSSYGWGRYASDLIMGAIENGHETIILGEDSAGIGRASSYNRLLLLIRSVLRVRSQAKECDIIHVLDGYPNAIIATLANIGLKKKIIITAIGTYSVAPLYKTFKGLLLRLSYKKALKIVAISNYTKNEILKKVSVDDIDVVNPGVNFDKFYTPRGSTGLKFILSVGALKRRKGYHVSIPAFAEAKKVIPNLVYKIVGDQSDVGYFNHLKQLVKNLNLEPDVQFVGKISQEELLDLYKHASLFALTSINSGHHFEGFGLVFCEAAAAGLPVLGTMGNGIEDAVGRDNGILVPQNNVGATSKAMIRILNDSDLWHHLSRAGYLWAKSHDLTFAANRYHLIYNQMTNKNVASND